jgi:hypothetical protein
MDEPNITQTFSEWISETYQSFGGKLVLITSFITTGFNLFVSLYQSEPFQYANLLILHITQLATILLIIVILAVSKVPEENSEYPRGSDAVKQFWKWWTGLWFGWFLLYAGLTSVEVYKLFSLAIDESWLQKLHVGLQQLNNISTLILLMLFYVLAKPSLSGRDPKPERYIFPDYKKSDENKKTKPNEFAIFILLISVFVALGVAEFMLVSINDKEYGIDVSKVFGIIYGILAATAISLVVGRLDSNLLGVSSLIVAFLMTYAAIQPSFDFIISTEKPRMTEVAMDVVKKTNPCVETPLNDTELSQIKSKYNLLIHTAKKRKDIQDKTTNLKCKIPPTLSSEFSTLYNSYLLIKSTQEVLIVIALICKIMLFAVVQWLAMTDRLLYYMVQAYSILVGVDGDRENFLSGRRRRVSNKLGPQKSRKLSWFRRRFFPDKDKPLKSKKN